MFGCRKGGERRGEKRKRGKEKKRKREEEEGKEKKRVESLISFIQFKIKLVEERNFIIFRSNKFTLVLDF